MSLGAVSEVWMWRQIVGMMDLSPVVLTWDYMDPVNYPLDDVPVKELKYDRIPMHRGRLTRWPYRLRCLPDLDFYGSVGAERREIVRFIEQHRPDVILGQFGTAALRIWPIAKRLGIPMVAHFHGFDISQELKNKWYRWSLARHARSFSAIVVVGNHQKHWFMEHGVSEDKIHVIPCGVPTEEFTPPEVRESGTIHFVTVSRLVKQKGLHHTVNAFADVAKRSKDVRLSIIGDGPELDILKSLAGQRGVADKISFKGFRKPKEVKEQLASSHVFLQHSLNYNKAVEGFGVSLSEAAAMELPIVATRCGGIEDQVIHGETGFLVDQHDEETMARHMGRLAEDKDLRERLGKAGRQRMLAHFDTTGQIDKLKNVLMNACEPSSDITTARKANSLSQPMEAH